MFLDEYLIYNCDPLKHIDISSITCFPASKNNSAIRQTVLDNLDHWTMAFVTFFFPDIVFLGGGTDA